MIRDNLGKRPIYFSWSDGNYPDGTLGLTEYLLTTGLVRKLMPKPIQEGNGIVLSKTLGFACELERIDAVTRIVATGGLAGGLAAVSRHIELYDRDLTLRGLSLIASMN